MNAQQQQQAQLIETMATQDLFKRMTGTCFTKCVRRYDDGEVTVGEGEKKKSWFLSSFLTCNTGACVERCVNKYLDTYKVVNEHLMAKNQQEMQSSQQQQM